MKWLWWIVGILVVGALGAGAYFYLYTDTLTSPISVSQLNEKDPNRYHWGTVVRPFALDAPGQRTTWERGIGKQLDLLQDMGGTIVRANIEQHTGVMDMLIDGANQRGLDVLLILEVTGDNPVLNNDIKKDQLYSQGKDLGREWAKRYKGKVQYYQLANEVTGTAAKRPEDEGPTLENRYDLLFDLNRAERVAEYTRGLADGVKQGDKNAKRMLTGHWVLVDIIPYLAEAGVDFELVGWDWYSDMGVDSSQTEVDGQPDLDLPAMMTELGKEFWLAEVNKEAGSFEGTTAAQAEYLKEAATAALADDDVTGFIVHMLPDMAAEQGEETGELGLVKVVEQDDGSWTFGPTKQAYTDLKEIFLANPTK